MERYQAELGKFGDIAKHAIENDPTFVNNLQQSVAMKNLSQTITYLKAKANEVSEGQNWTVDDVKECAYVLFVLTIQSLSMDENNKVIMATSLYRRITGRTLEERNASRAAPMAPSPAPMAPGPKRPTMFSTQPSAQPGPQTLSPMPMAPSPAPAAPGPAPMAPSPTPAMSVDAPLTPTPAPPASSPLSSMPSGPKIATNIEGPVESKDIIIENLKKQLEEYKKSAETHTYEHLTTKISELQEELKKKEEEIKVLKEVGGVSEDEAQLKTRLIVLQSKLRQKEKEVEDLKAGQGAVPSTPAPTPVVQPADPQEIDILRRQLDQERRTVERLREQINTGAAGGAAGGGAQVKVLQAENAQLREELKRVKESQSESTGESDQVQELRNLLSAKENQIAQMEAAMARTGKGSTYLAERKYQRKVEELESQIKVMKKAELEMKKRFEEAMLKFEYREDDGW